MATLIIINKFLSTILLKNQFESYSDAFFQNEDPVVAKLLDSTEEGQKVTRNNGDKFLAAFKRVPDSFAKVRLTKLCYILYAIAIYFCGSYNVLRNNTLFYHTTCFNEISIKLVVAVDANFYY